MVWREVAPVIFNFAVSALDGCVFISITHGTRPQEYNRIAPIMHGDRPVRQMLADGVSKLRSPE